MKEHYEQKGQEGQTISEERRENEKCKENCRSTEQYIERTRKIREGLKQENWNIPFIKEQQRECYYKDLLTETRQQFPESNEGGNRFTF